MLPDSFIFEGRVSVANNMAYQQWAGRACKLIYPSAVQDCFIFRVEGTGALQTHEVVSMALDWLQSKMKNLREALASSLEEEIPMEM